MGGWIIKAGTAVCAVKDNPGPRIGHLPKVGYVQVVQPSIVITPDVTQAPLAIQPRRG